MKSKLLLSAALAASVLLGGCAGMDGFWDDLRGTPQYYSQRSVPIEEMPAFPRYCLPGDAEVEQYGQCAAAEIHCYQRDIGSWCAGPYSPFVISYMPDRMYSK